MHWRQAHIFILHKMVLMLQAENSIKINYQIMKTNCEKGIVIYTIL